MADWSGLTVLPERSDRREARTKGANVLRAAGIVTGRKTGDATRTQLNTMDGGGWERWRSWGLVRLHESGSNWSSGAATARSTRIFFPSAQSRGALASPTAGPASSNGLQWGDCGQSGPPITYTASAVGYIPRLAEPVRSGPRGQPTSKKGTRGLLAVTTTYVAYHPPCRQIARDSSYLFPVRAACEEHVLLGQARRGGSLVVQSAPGLGRQGSYFHRYDKRVMPKLLVPSKSPYQADRSLRREAFDQVKLQEQKGTSARLGLQSRVEASWCAFSGISRVGSLAGRSRCASRYLNSPCLHLCPLLVILHILGHLARSNCCP